ncbi:MAG: lysine--tRNA ligase [Candidatus Pacebacteria bacterium]|jgi:lysyl-tRNA synthetase, class I|nr:lysine--tRNA ligase [Candidatus Paceibacterota bacterium]MBT4651870.1 lysine--tRNA ligase [Candidatus Paceibacterota bacterium]MBT6755690.1 lysine--tRNA ligase [Candidatus Paceibacterota bacterium]MBT6921196.1 lysine--tRNA ligase [Candidatus Paceibacterota bacterium]
MKNTSTQHSYHWADKLISNIYKWREAEKPDKLHVDDMKTPSGRVHTGSLRGVLLHDLVAKVLSEKEKNVINTYVFNDMDPMDGLPGYLNQEEYKQHMGKPMFMIPAPPLSESGLDVNSMTPEEKARFEKAENFGEFYAQDFIDAFRKLGCDQEIVWSHELYKSGKMDEVIRTALDNVAEMKKIYKEIADYDLPDNWYPFQVVCPDCGKLGTTLVTGWDGEQVTYECQKNKVEWAEGCENSGKISPFGGNGKLLWKADWPAHWAQMEVTIEGAGKDHSSAGGSRDMANAMLEKVYKTPLLFDIPYEWILIRGTKMSSSKGIGTSAREFVELFPPEIGRYLFVSKHYNKVIDFDPTTQAIPDLFDEYDLGAKIFWKQEIGEDIDLRMGRSFELSQIDGVAEAMFLPRFRDVALWMQHPEINLVEKFIEIKGSKLTEIELKELEERRHYARLWVDRYAPDEYQLTFRADKVVKELNDLTEEEKTYLSEIQKLILTKDWDPQELQQEMFNVAKESLGARKGFQSVYKAFLGRKSGPRASWFLLSLNKEERDDRFYQAIQGMEEETKKYRYELIDDPSLLSISPAMAEKYPTATIGLAVIKGIKVDKSNPGLEKEKQEIFQQYYGHTAKDLGDFSELSSYRKMYREMGVDWHSRRPSPEALLRRVVQGKELYTINTCVDAYNLVVMRNRVSAGAFDLKNMSGSTILDIAKGGEQAVFIGSDDPVTLKAGEVCYFDDNGPYNMDFNYRDASRVLINEDTTDIVLNIDGIHDISREQVEQTLHDVVEMITHYCGGTVEKIGIVQAKKED